MGKPGSCLAGCHLCLVTDVRGVCSLCCCVLYNFIKASHTQQQKLPVWFLRILPQFDSLYRFHFVTEAPGSSAFHSFGQARAGATVFKYMSASHTPGGKDLE